MIERRRALAVLASSPLVLLITAGKPGCSASRRGGWWLIRKQVWVGEALPVDLNWWDWHPEIREGQTIWVRNGSPADDALQQADSWERRFLRDNEPPAGS